MLAPRTALAGATLRGVEECLMSVSCGGLEREGPWEDHFGLQTSCASPMCVGVCALNCRRVCECVDQRLLHGLLPCLSLFVSYFYQLFMAV